MHGCLAQRTLPLVLAAVAPESVSAVPMPASTSERMTNEWRPMDVPLSAFEHGQTLEDLLAAKSCVRDLLRDQGVVRKERALE